MQWSDDRFGTVGERRGGGRWSWRHAAAAAFAVCALIVAGAVLPAR